MRSPSWRTGLAALGIGALALATACADGSNGPTTPNPPSGSDLQALAFQLTIDAQTGTVTVSRSPGVSPSRAAGGPSFSLIGSDAVALHATNCTWSNTPNNSKQRRCTFGLAVEDRLANTDLVAPTTFPKPPQGIGGILVFPYTAAALGVPGSSATPDPDWDNAPANFFNDFGGCTTGKTSDCYRSETYPAPLYAGENTAPRSVGFDVDRNAQSVAVYIVVAADLRDNPLQLTDLPGDPTLCGEVLNEGVVFGYVASTGDPTLGGGFERRGFCSFTLPDIHLVRATLQLYQASIHGTASATVYADEGPAIVDHLDYGSSLDPGDYLLAALQADIGTLSTDATIEYKSLDVTPSVQDDIVNGRSASQFRLRLATEIGEDAIIDFAGPTQQNPPKLTLAYRNK